MFTGPYPLHKVSRCSDLASLLGTEKPVRDLSFHDNSPDEDTPCRWNSFHLDASRARAERKEGRKEHTANTIWRPPRESPERSGPVSMQYAKVLPASYPSRLTPSRVPSSRSFTIPLSLHPSGPL